MRVHTWWRGKMPFIWPQDAHIGKGRDKDKGARMGKEKKGKSRIKVKIQIQVWLTLGWVCY